MLQKWDWTQTDTHDEAIAVLQDERMQDEQQLIHQSLTQLGANWRLNSIELQLENVR